MRILVLSDSHGFRGKLEQVLMKVESTGPLDAVVHLGDGYRDMRPYEEHLPPLYVTPGNCDGDRGTALYPELGGVRVFMTHGHHQQVKSGLHRLLAAAMDAQCAVALFGHTHKPYCQEHLGLWLVNPGSVMDGHFAVLTIDSQGDIHPELY